MVCQLMNLVNNNQINNKIIGAKRWNEDNLKTHYHGRQVKADRAVNYKKCFQNY